MTEPRCGSCGEPCSWIDARFGGHCTPRSAGSGHRVASRDTTVEGYHPGLGHVTGTLDLERKIEKAKRAGKVVTHAKDIPEPGERPRVDTGKPSAWERTMEQMRGA